MKIGILTYHRALNYGALLQAFALKTTLEQNGAEVSVLDYRNEVIESLYSLSFKDKKGFKNKLRVLRQSFVERDKREKFENFRSSYLITERRIFNAENIQDANQIFDRFVVGSDQVWNPDGHRNDLNFFLKFVKEPSKIFSYAASFGVETLDEKYCAQLGSLLQRFSVCSVRESAGVEILKSIGIQNIRMDVDPVFLLDREKWQSALKIRSRKRNYALLYYFALTDVMKSMAKTCQERGLEVVVIGKPRKSPFDFPVTFIDGVGPIEFVELFFNASFVITNSFHGTAFSSLFNVPMAVELLPGESSKVNSRLLNILKLLELERRFIDKKIDCEGFLKQSIAWDQVNDKIGRLRENSLKYIREVLVNE